MATTPQTAKRKGRYAMGLSKCSTEHPTLFELKAQGEVLLTQISNLFNTYYRVARFLSALAKFEGVPGL